MQIKFLPRGEGINVYVEREILNHSVLLHPQCGPPYCHKYLHSALGHKLWLSTSSLPSDKTPCSALRMSVIRSHHSLHYHSIGCSREMPTDPLFGPASSIIQFREVFLTPDYLAIAMEFATGGDMFQYVKRKKGLQARFRLSFV